MKTIPLSVRISHEDAEFIANITIDGAKTPSDKIRAILKEKRKSKLAGNNYSEVLTNIENYLLPISRQIKEIQHEKNTYSQVIDPIRDSLADLLAYFISSGKIIDDTLGCQEFENELMERVSRLFERTIHLGIIQSTNSTRKNVFRNKLNIYIQLLRLLDNETKLIKETL
jgi:hypothetical protein